MRLGSTCSLFINGRMMLAAVSPATVADPRQIRMIAAISQPNTSGWIGQSCNTVAISWLTPLAVNTSFSAPAPAASAATSTFTVNLGSSTGAVMHGATGALYGVSDAGVPSANLITPLNVPTIAEGPPGDTQHPNGDAGKISASFMAEDSNGKILVYLQDIYSSWPYPTETESSYLSTVNTIMSAIDASPQKADFELVPFNEPDQQWFDLAGGSSYYSTFYTWWDAVYSEIRSDDPGAVIVGPNESGFDSAFMPASASSPASSPSSSAAKAPSPPAPPSPPPPPPTRTRPPSPCPASAGPPGTRAGRRGAMPRGVGRSRAT